MRNPGFRVAFFLANPQAVQELTSHDWLGLIHPVLMILFVYPVVGATIRLGILARERRLEINPIADTVPVEHAQHGTWVTGGVLVAVLIGLSHSLWATHPLGLLLTGHCLIRHGQPELLACVETVVRFAALSQAEIEAYVASGEPLQCAGGFALEGRGGLCIDGLDGCYSNVIGFPGCVSSFQL